VVVPPTSIPISIFIRLSICANDKEVYRLCDLWLTPGFDLAAASLIQKCFGMTCRKKV